jgi:hypothetical protein
MPVISYCHECGKPVPWGSPCDCAAKTIAEIADLRAQLQAVTTQRDALAEKLGEYAQLHIDNTCLRAGLSLAREWLNADDAGHGYQECQACETREKFRAWLGEQDGTLKRSQKDLQSTRQQSANWPALF